MTEPEVTEEQKQLLARRLKELPLFLKEVDPAVAALRAKLELDDAVELRACLPAIDALLERERSAEEPEDPMWLLTHVGYFVGEVLRRELDGKWLVNEVPKSRTFTSYVVGEFAGCSPTAVVDPFQVAHAVVAGVGTKVAAVVDQIEADLEKTRA